MQSKKFSPLLVCFLIAYGLYAQAPNDFRSQYPDEDVITISLEKHIEIKEVRGKLSISQNVHKQNLFLTTNTLRHTEDRISYNTFNRVAELKAHTLNQSNGKPKRYPVTDFIDKDVLMNNVFFNDQKEKKIIYSNVEENSITDLEYKLSINDPHFIPPFIFGSGIPVVNAKVSVEFPNNVKVSFKEFNLDTVNSKFEKKELNGKTIYSWTLTEIPKLNRHYDFSPLFYIPQIIVFIDSYEHRGQKIPVLNSSKDLYQWYTSLTEKINKTNQAELQNITKELTKNASSEEEKIKNIYYFIQDRINYIAFEDGLNGFIPRDAAKVFVNKYGDCKDMANILNEMLHYAGIDSHLTWIGTRTKPYSYKDVPTPVTDNHMITAVISENKDTLYLDATAKYLPFGYPSPFIQGKEALIGLSTTEHKIANVPEVAAEKNKIIVLNKLNIENEKLVGTHTTKLNGYEKLGIMHRIENKSREDLDFLYWNLKLGTKQTSFFNIDYQDMERAKDTLTISFNSETKGFIKNINGKLYVKPNIDHHMLNDLVKDESKAFAKKIDHKSNKTFHTVLQIPAGYDVDFIPKNEVFENEQFNYSITYEKLGDEIIIQKQITINTLKIDVEAMNQWNTFIKSLLKANKKTIVLQQKA
ncbi:DUF3857 domain-containing protein [Maribacter algarum]|uniref:DUF3857 domain-containing protein n=1 Tax=Maribacter algarum (ex Zhang et al. 2020) TaxID=2578118 RepID=A0A5S3PPG8_9FLAO|nr:DUF3857 domain-containing protein [Maribacter algarum]TMM56636.1 DUF3857 domain-containing protein [Maribacter algarum]